MHYTKKEEAGIDYILIFIVVMFWIMSAYEYLIAMLEKL
jgi:hypothetical protein